MFVTTDVFAFTAGAVSKITDAAYKSVCGITIEPDLGLLGFITAG